LRTVTIKVDEELKQKMRKAKINWSAFVRNAIRQKMELEERRTAAEKLLEDLKARKHVAPRGFINRTIRETREAH
jgi:post-segregation antitoxin (ccd killing protein)